MSPAAPHRSPAPGTTREAADWAEELACDHLRAKGYTVVERNWRSGRYEIDIVCQKGGRLVFVEVKKRLHGTDDQYMSVVPAQRRRLIQAADSYLRQQTVPFEYQFDIVAISGPRSGARIEHIEDAFFPSPSARR